MSDRELFSEDQSFGLLATVATLLPIGVLFIAGLMSVPSQPLVGSTIAAGTFFCFLFILNGYQLRVSVSRDRVCARFGRVFPIWWKNVRPVDVESVKVVDLGWSRWNLGVHLDYFRGRFAITMLAGGSRAVYIERTKGLAVVIGSEQPERLAEAIARARSETSR